MDVKYIHYGDDKFILEKFNSITNILGRNKPYGGLWASRIDANYGWDKWCKDNEFHIEKLNKYFTFTLENKAKILEIHSVEDMEGIPIQKFNDLLFKINYYPDFEAIINQGYDAIELFMSSASYAQDITETLYFRLYRWDCDSILILNPEIILPQ